MIGHWYDELVDYFQVVWVSYNLPLVAEHFKRSQNINLCFNNKTTQMIGGHFSFCGGKYQPQIAINVIF